MELIRTKLNFSGTLLASHSLVQLSFSSIPFHTYLVGEPDGEASPLGEMVTSSANARPAAKMPAIA